MPFYLIVDVRTCALNAAIYFIAAFCFILLHMKLRSIIGFRSPISKWRRNIAENFNRLSRMHKSYRDTTDIWQTDGIVRQIPERNVPVINTHPSIPRGPSNFVTKLGMAGKELRHWATFSENCIILTLAVFTQYTRVADDWQQTTKKYSGLSVSRYFYGSILSLGISWYRASLVYTAE